MVIIVMKIAQLQLPKKKTTKKVEKSQKNSPEPTPVNSENQKIPQTKNGGKLPKSTTNQPKWIAAGAATTLIGMYFMVLGLRRNQRAK